MHEYLSGFIKEQIDQTREWIGRDISVFTPTRSACTLCQPSGYYDSTGDTSYYITCPVCQGAYWLLTDEETVVLARIHWVDNEAITASPGGKYFLGDANVTVDPSYHSLFVRAQNESGRVVVDGQDMQITKIRPVGAPTINRYRIILKGMGDRPEI